MLVGMRSQTAARSPSDSSRCRADTWHLAFPISSRSFAMLFAALLLPGGLLVLAWMLYCSFARRKRRSQIRHRSATLVSTGSVLTSSAPQHGPPAGGARGATAERAH